MTVSMYACRWSRSIQFQYQAINIIRYMKKMVVLLRYICLYELYMYFHLCCLLIHSRWLFDWCLIDDFKMVLNSIHHNFEFYSTICQKSGLFSRCFGIGDYIFSKVSSTKFACCYVLISVFSYLVFLSNLMQQSTNTTLCEEDCLWTVSYTHLTLPTILLV